MYFVHLAAMAECGKYWAQVSAKTLARRLRRERRHEHGYTRAQALHVRTKALRIAIAQHWQLQDTLGATYSSFAEAIRAAKVLQLKRDYVDEQEALAEGNWARHAPPPMAPPEAPRCPGGIKAAALEAFRDHIYVQAQLRDMIEADWNERNCDDINGANPCTEHTTVLDATEVAELHVCDKEVNVTEQDDRSAIGIEASMGVSMTSRSADATVSAAVDQTREGHPEQEGVGEGEVGGEQKGGVGVDRCDPCHAAVDEVKTERAHQREFDTFGKRNSKFDSSMDCKQCDQALGKQCLVCCLAARAAETEKTEARLVVQRRLLQLIIHRLIYKDRILVEVAPVSGRLIKHPDFPVIGNADGQEKENFIIEANNDITAKIDFQEYKRIVEVLMRFMADKKNAGRGVKEEDLVAWYMAKVKEALCSNHDAEVDFDDESGDEEEVESEESDECHDERCHEVMSRQSVAAFGHVADLFG